MNSKLYVGQVRHRRFTPRQHEFSYAMFMVYLDLDELDHVFKPFAFWSSDRFNLAWFRRSDHLGDAQTSLKQAVVELVQTLKQAVVELVQTRIGVHIDGPVRLLTHLRYLGIGFNPVSFYYCYDRNEQLRAIVAEVNNTPWGEQHCYVQQVMDTDATHHHFKLNKQFHVSPFNPMNQYYKWCIREPDQYVGVHMENWQDENRIFDASISMDARPISHGNLGYVLLRFPLITLKVLLAIYWQALKLWLKRIPIFDHPGSTESTIQTADQGRKLEQRKAD